MKKSFTELVSGFGGPNEVKKKILGYPNRNTQDSASSGASTYQCEDVSSVDLRQSCALFRDFETGTGLFSVASDDAKRELLAGLAMALCHVPDGADYFLKRVHEDSIFDVPNMEWPWEQQIRYFCDKGYWPIKCDKFCPNAGSCNHASDMLKTATMAAGTCNNTFRP